MPKTLIAAAVAFSAVLCFGHIHQGSLAIDGVRYAHIANNILRHSSWVTLFDEFGGGEYANKPPLLFWLIALSFRAWGYSTAAANLPAAAMLFLGLMLLFFFCRSLYDDKAGLLAVLLFSCNSVFLKTYLHLGFEGLVTIGAVCCLWAVLLFLKRKMEPTATIGFLFGAGLLFLLQSKPPYILFVLGPVALLLYRRKLVGRALSRLWPLVAAALPLGIGTVWFIVQKDDYLGKALSNQVGTPMVVAGHYVANLLDWVKQLVAYYQPLPLLGLIAVYRELRRGESATLPESAMKELFLLMTLLTVPIVFLIDCRARYLIIPMIGLSCYTAGSLRGVLSDLSYRRLSVGLAGGSVAALVLLSRSLIEVHEVDPLVSALRKAPAELTNGTLLCVDGKRTQNSRDTLKRTELLLDLEFGYRGPVYSSSQILEQFAGSSKPVLAESRCSRALIRAAGPKIEIKKITEESSLLALASEPTTGS